LIWLAWPWSPALETVLMIDARGWRPSFDSLRQYTDAWCIVLKAPYMCTLTTASKSSGVIENIILSLRIPRC
jgi:hypothetical protein